MGINAPQPDMKKFAKKMNKYTFIPKTGGKRKMPAKRKTTKKKSSKRKGATPTNPTLYARVKAEAKRKFKVYPSAYANGWVVRTYKKRGGGYR